MRVAKNPIWLFLVIILVAIPGQSLAEGLAQDESKVVEPRCTPMSPRLDDNVKEYLDTLTDFTPVGTPVTYFETRNGERFKVTRADFIAIDPLGKMIRVFGGCTSTCPGACTINGCTPTREGCTGCTCSGVDCGSCSCSPGFAFQSLDNFVSTDLHLNELDLLPVVKESPLNR